MDPLKKFAEAEPAKQVFSLFEEFKNFAFKGNVIDLAVGFIIGNTPFGLEFAPSTWPAPFQSAAIVALHGRVGSYEGARVIALSPWRIETRDDASARRALRTALRAAHLVFTSPNAVRAAGATARCCLNCRAAPARRVSGRATTGGSRSGSRVTPSPPPRSGIAWPMASTMPCSPMA